MFSLFASRYRCLALVLLGLVLTGCQEDKIEVYEVAKQPVTLPENHPAVSPGNKPVTEQSQASSSPAANEQGPPTDRMLGAMIDHGNRTWYFKLTGPIAAVDAAAKKIESFFNTIQFDDAESAKPTWKLPEGWEQQDASGMRLATLRLESDGEPLEMSVIALPKRPGAGDQFTLANVNRWRGQMGLASVEKLDAEPDTIKQRTTHGKPMTLVDLRGHQQPSTMGPMSGMRGRMPINSPPNKPATKNNEAN